MNHYPRHVGDWITATAHLTEVEECIYSRMVDQYYAREGPLPREVAAVTRLVRASNAVARKAVRTVLEEFFSLEDDGWHQKRCDEELAAFGAGQGEAASRRENEKERQRRHRERRKQLFDTLRERGVTAPWDASVTDLERLCHEPVTRDSNAPVTRTATAVTTTQNQNQNQGERASPARARATRPPKTPIPDDFAISPTVRQWAAEHGHDRLDERLQHFVGKAKANGYRYADWDQALQNAIRDDWAALNNRRSPRGGSSLSDVGHRTADALGTWLNDEEQANGTTGP